MVHEIRCSDEEHETRAGEPGFAAVVGTIDLPGDMEPTPAQLAGARCAACARARGLLPVEVPDEIEGDPTP